MSNIQSRQLRSNDKNAVSKYITTLYDELQKRDVFSCQNRLDCGPTDHNLVNHIDKLFGIASDLAEKNCKPRRPHYYSDKLVQHRITLSLLRAHLNALRLGVDRSQPIRQRMMRLGLDFELPPTMRMTKQALDAAAQALSNSQQDHLELRRAYLDDRIGQARTSGTRQTEKALHAIKKVETSRQTYRIMQAIRKPLNTNTLDRLEVPESWPPATEIDPDIHSLEDPKACRVWKLITNPREIEYYLMLRNRLHFGQADGTPLTKPPFSMASTDAAEAILQGKCHLSSYSTQCQDLLNACQAIDGQDTISPTISKDEFRGKVMSWKERTTTSPSGRHLGRYKALFARGPLENKQENFHSLPGASLEKKQEAIASLLLSVINYCLRHQHVLPRWKTVVNVMIFKESRNYKIHRLRVIHIYEADFNMILALKWRRLLRETDNKQLLHPGQYGGRPGCEAQSLTLLEELKYDLAYLTRRTLVIFDNDASSCYDRILVPFASLINRRYGMHRNVVAVHAMTLQQAIFRLKTASGMSDISYQHCAQFPIHGTGQGSGNSPCIWLFISCTLFTAHQQKAHGVTYVAPDGQEQVHMSMVGFVDDSTGSCNDFQPSTQVPLSTILQRMEQDAQRWNTLLHCSGGKLELPKCSFHVLHFNFKPDGKPFPSIENYDGSIRIQDPESQCTISIPSKRAFEFHKTLGHHKSPITNETKSIEPLCAKANHLAHLMSMSPINRQGMQVAYHTIYIPTIRYTLPQSFYSKRLLEQCQAKSLHKIISKCGYNRHTARALLFAPTTFAGGGFLPWHVLQGEGQIQHVIKHWRTNTIISKTMRIALKWAQWQSGHAISILEDTTTKIPFLECRWIQSMRSFMAEIGASFFISPPITIPKETSNDAFIMQIAREWGNFEDKDLHILNNCRLYLHLATISEMFDATGKQLMPHIWKCVREPWFAPTTYIVLQQRPSEYQIRTKWQKFCRHISKLNGEIAESISLGKWIVPGHKLR